MKRMYFLALAILVVCNLTAQNVGIGTTEPQNKLQVQGNLLVTTPTTATSTAPTIAQTKTMVNASTVSFATTDSTGRIYDPGGPSGNYLPNLLAYAYISQLAGIGIELNIETMDLGTGDSLIIKRNPTGTTFMAVGNGYTTTGKVIFSSTELYFIFKSNADANTGAGFSLLFRRLYDNSSSLPDVSGFSGNGLFFNTKNGAFKSGYLNISTQGLYSTAMGYNTTASSSYSTAMGGSTTASGNYSTAMGGSTTASGDYSTAMGRNTGASGDHSTAMGFITTASGTSSTAMGYSTTASGGASTAMGGSTNASGDYSTAMGYFTTASGLYSTAMGGFTTASGLYCSAMGRNTTASGDYSTAMGNYVSTNNLDGSLIIGDNSTTTVLNIATANSFRARFDGGYRFFTSAAAINAESCQLPAGGNAWVTASDSRLKEKITIADGEDFLKKISTMKLGSWNYLSQNPLKQRHYGPMAQDFYAAFGKDEFGTIGNDTTINSADFDGVNFIAIQALEKRTQKIEQLEKENEELKKMLLQLRKEMDEIKAIKTR